MELRDFIAAAKAYSDLGWAVQEQFEDLLAAHEQRSLDELDINLNALEMIEDFLRDLAGHTVGPFCPPAIDQDELAEVLATAEAYRIGPEEQDDGLEGVA